MLGNNNKKILNKLAKNTLRRNKKQMSILFLTICLSAFMLFSVFTLGITYLDLSRQQDTRLNGAEYDIALMNGFTEQQKESLEENSFTRSVGTESYAGYVKSTEYDDTVDTGLLWCDQTFWEEQMAPARTKTEGFYPQEKNQLMVTREGLKALGKEDLQIGDSLSLTYEDNTGIHTGEFVISGIWDGYGDKAPVFVSEEFYKQSDYRLEYDGILCIKLKQNFLLPGTIDKIEDSTGLEINNVSKAVKTNDDTVDIKADGSASTIFPNLRIRNTAIPINTNSISVAVMAPSDENIVDAINKQMVIDLSSRSSMTAFFSK